MSSSSEDLANTEESKNAKLEPLIEKTPIIIPIAEKQSRREFINTKVEHVRKMPLKDKISLGPIEKYTIYNRFPYKLSLHIMLLVLTSLIVSNQVQQAQSQLRSQQFVFYKKFLLNAPDDEVPVSDDFNREKRFFSVKDLKKFSITSLDNYYAMNMNATEFENYNLTGNSSEIQPPQLWRINLNPLEQASTLYPLNQIAGNEGGHTYSYPFNLTDIQFKSWIQETSEYQINMDNVVIQYPEYSTSDHSCLSWNITIRCFHTEQPQVRVQLDMFPSACIEHRDDINLDLMVILTIIFALASFMLELMYIAETSKIIKKLKQLFDKSEDQAQSSDDDDTKDLIHQGNEYAKADIPKDLQTRRNKLIKEANWKDLLFWDKLRLFDMWSIVSIMANLTQILGCLYSTFRNHFNLSTADSNLGLGCMLAWWVMLRYLLKTQAYKSMLASFSKSAPFVARALISMIPLFIGYAFLGMAIFWESRRFADFSVSCYTLFALMHGDMIWDTYNDLIQIDSVLAQVFLYSYIFISISVIANIFTIIIEEGFMKQKYDNDYSWLHQHIRKHLGLEDDSNTGDQDGKENDGINVDSDVIVSEYRLLYLKYKDQIKQYKQAIANLSLKQIINNEEEAWVQHKAFQQHITEHNTETNRDATEDEDMHSCISNEVCEDDATRLIQNVSTFEFDQEIQQLSLQLKEKILSLKKDYRDLKIFKNKDDIANAREKLLVFVKKLITDTNFLISSIQRNFDRNIKALESNIKDKIIV